tara:strand:+ start:668 stop:841 length:174 start_codon:yes stop_codon:yes gene_type:complete
LSEIEKWWITAVEYYSKRRATSQRITYLRRLTLRNGDHTGAVDDVQDGGTCEGRIIL